MRGVLHLYAFVASIAAGGLLVGLASGGRERAAAGVFAVTLTAMFGASALYNIAAWPPRRQRLLQRLDHSMIYGLIAGTYTPYGLLVLSGGWRYAVLAVVWTGAAVAIVLRLAWTDAPRWLAAALAVGLGWAGVASFPVVLDRIGGAGAGLLLAGGLLYTAGAAVYVRRRPDPVPAVFGYHEVFHALVVLAAGCQYASVATFAL